MKLSLINAALVASCTSFAFAASAGGPPKYTELPLGHVTSPNETNRPDSVPATESVPGFVVVGGRYANAKSLMLVGNEKIAADIQASKGTLDDGGICFTQRPANVPVADPTPRIEWDQPLTRQLHVYAPGPSSVVLIHAERLLERNGSMILETNDAWADVTTKGIRLIRRETMPLTVVGTAPGGIKIFLGRDERPSGLRFAQLVVARTFDPNHGSAVGASVTKSDGTAVGGSQCGQTRIGVALAKPGADSATVVLNAILPPLEPGEKSGGAPVPVFAGQAENPNLKELRTRPVRVHFSVSQTAHEKEPVVSVSIGWGGREQQQRVFVAPPQSFPASNTHFPDF